jgi:HK97 family phage major capsid protein
MSRTAKLLEKRAALIDDMEKIADLASSEDRDLTVAEKASFDQRDEESKSLDAQIEIEKRLETKRAATAKPVVATTPAQAKGRHGSLKAFKGANAEEDAYSSGMFLKATLFGDGKAAEWCHERGLVNKYQNGGTNPSGGYVVPLQMETAIIDLRETYGTFRANCRTVPMSSDRMSIPRRTGGVTAYFVDESVAITESEKTWGQVQLVAKKLAALTRVSSELAEDAVINIADDLAQEMAWAFAKKEDECGWIGDGTSTYGGVVGFKSKFVAGLGSFVGAVDAASNNDTFAEITTADLLKVMGTLPNYARANAKWYCSQFAFANMFHRLGTAAGGVTMMEIGGEFRKSFLGYEVVIDQSLPAVATDLSDVPMVYFGDIGLAAKMGSRRGISVRTLNERYAEYDQIGVMATERFDIVVHDIGDATAAGAVVALMGE